MFKQSFDRFILGATLKAGEVFRSKYGIWLVAMISFVESALPIPLITDPFMAAHILVNRSRVYMSVAVTVIASIAGGFIAFLASSTLYFWLVTYLSPEAVIELETIIDRFKDGTFLITLLGAVTPIPYTFVAIGAGFMQGNVWAFLLASVMGRFIRYAVVGYIVYWYGPEMLARARQNVRVATIISVLLLAAYLYYKLGNM